MTIVGEAFIAIKPESSTFARDTEAQVGNQAGEAGKNVGKRFAQGIKDAVVVAAVGKVLLDSLGEADVAAKGLAQTNAVLRSTAGVAGVTADHIDELTESLSRKVAVDDDVIRQGTNLLLTFTKIHNEVDDGTGTFDRATAVMVDMGAALGTDAAGSAIQLGKALNDPIRGITALTRVGVTFTDQQREQIKAMVEAGDVASAQGVILDELEREFGGSAEAQATALDRVKVASGELKEEIGGALMPTIGAFVPVANTAVDAIAAIPGPLQAVVVAGGGVVALAGPLGRSVEGFRSLSSLGDGFRDSAGALTRFGSVALTLAPVAVGFGLLTAAVLAHRDAQADDERATDALGAAIREQGGDVTTGLLGVLADTLEGGGVLDDLNRTGIALDDVADRVAGSRDEFSSLDTALKNTDEHFHELPHAVQQQRDALIGLVQDQLEASIASRTLNRELLNQTLLAGENADGSSIAANGVRQLTAALEDGSLSYEEAANLGLRLDDVLHAIGVSTEGVGSGAEGAAGGLDAMGDELATTGQEALTAQERMDRLKDSVGEFFAESTRHIDAQVAFRDSLRALADVGEDVNEQQLTGEERLDEYRSALSRGVRDVDAFTQSLIDNNASTEDVIAQTNDYVQQLFDTADQAGLTEREVSDLRSAFHLWPEEVATTISTNAQQAGTDLQGVLDLIAAFPRLLTIDLQTTTMTLIGKHAAGGQVFAGGAGLVGEAGPEMFVPTVDGTILSADRTAGLATRDDLLAVLAAMSAGGGSSVSYNVGPVYGATVEGARATARRTVAELRAAEYVRSGRR